jgi:hypothetical protein
LNGTPSNRFRSPRGWASSFGRNLETLRYVAAGALGGVVLVLSGPSGCRVRLSWFCVWHSGEMKHG